MSISLAQWSSLNPRAWCQFMSTYRPGRRAQRLSPVLGIDLGTTAVKTVAVVPGRQRIHLAGFAIIERKPEHGDDSTAVVKAVDRALNQTHADYHRQNAASVIPDDDALTDVFTIPTQLDEQAIAARVDLHINTALNKSTDELCYDYRCAPSTSSNEQAVLIVTAREETVDQRRRPIEEAGLTCALIDIESHAIARVIAHAAPSTSENPIAIVDLGSRLRLAVIHEHQPIFQHTVNQPLNPNADALIQAITRALALYQGCEQAQPLSKIWLVGGLSNNRLSHRLAEQTGIQTQCLAELITVESATEGDTTDWQSGLPRLITALGAALHLGDPNAHWH